MSVDMLIAETLSDAGGAPTAGSGSVPPATPASASSMNATGAGGKNRGPGGTTVHNGERFAFGVTAPVAEPNVVSGTGTGAWYAETEGVGVASGMGVIDVGSEGDKKKRLNRQSANYGSKAVACVHCRGKQPVSRV